MVASLYVVHCGWPRVLLLCGAGRSLAIPYNTAPASDRHHLLVVTNHMDCDDRIAKWPICDFSCKMPLIIMHRCVVWWGGVWYSVVCCGGAMWCVCTHHFR